MPDPSGRAGLTRRYRRLLLTYPRRYRRERGAEIVTTLVDAAPADRVRPTRSEAADLLLGGVRYRFRVRGAGGLLVAACGAVLAAVALGAFGGFLGWQTAPPLPSDAEAARIVQPAFLGTTVPQRSGERFDFVFADDPGFTDPAWVYWLTGTDNYGYGHLHLTAPHPGTTSEGAVVDAARRRLQAAGWRVGALRAPDPLAASAVAVRDGWRMEITTSTQNDSDRSLEVELARATPGAVLPSTSLGLAVGAVTGWLLAAAAYRRGRTVGPVWKAFAIVSYAHAVLALLPATVLSAAAIVAGYLAREDLIPGWVGYVTIFFRTLAWLGLLALVGAFLFASLPRRRGVRLVTG